MVSKFIKTQDPVVRSVTHLLKQLKVNVTTTTINDVILSHPDFPSILCVSDALNEWKVNNTVLQVDADKLSQLSLPFIAYVSNNGGEFMVVTNVNDDDDVIYLNNNEKSVVISKIEFLKKWNGISLVPTTSALSGEHNYKKNKKKEQLKELQLPALVIIGLILTAVAVFNNSNSLNASTGFIFGYSTLLIIKLLGITISSLLLWYEIDKANPALQKICSIGGSKTNCSAILSSKQSKLFSWLSWSEIGFFYFAGGFLSLISSSLIYVLPVITILNILALPYIIFSVFYQWRIAKQWCVLCLCVQALLAFEFVISYSANLIQLPTINSQALSILASFSIPMIVWFILKPNLLKSQANKESKHELNRIKSNSTLFESLLQNQKQVEFDSQGLGITIGNPMATNTIIKVCNPYCGPCASAHPEIEELLKNTTNLKVQVIFTASNDEKDYRNKPVKHLLAIAEKNNEKTNQALDDWYLPKEKDYTVFANKYPLNGELKKQDKKIELMQNWCENMRIKETPTFFVNGFQLPDVYSIKDLKYLLVEE